MLVTSPAEGLVVDFPCVRTAGLDDGYRQLTPDSKVWSLRAGLSISIFRILIQVTIPTQMVTVRTSPRGKIERDRCEAFRKECVRYTMGAGVGRILCVYA